MNKRMKSIHWKWSEVVRNNHCKSQIVYIPARVATTAACNLRLDEMSTQPSYLNQDRPGNWLVENLDEPKYLSFLQWKLSISLHLDFGMTTWP
jgi:hypothetical protein